jgi:glutamate carboxypeptidase
MTKLSTLESLVAVVVATAMTGTPVAAQGVAPVEADIITAVDERAAEAVDLLERLVNINSGTMNFAGVREVGDVLLAEFDALGFETEWIDGTPFERAGHLVARRRGTQGPHLLLIGHLDTVFEPSSPFQRFTLGADSVATGPGVGDMKGGNVVIVSALKALRAAGRLDEMTITVVMTGDEERSGSPLSLARAVLIEAAEAADIAIAFEDGDGDPTTAVVARRGSTGWRVEVTGTRAHSSQIFQPQVGAGAIYEAARILTDFYDRLAGQPNLTFNPGVILGGSDVEFDAFTAGGTAAGKNNVVAEKALVTGDLRAITPEQVELARETMRHVVRQSRPGTEATISFSDGYPPLAPTEGNYQLLGVFDQVSRDLGFGAVAAVNPRNAGAADVSFTAGLVDMAIDGLGPGGSGGHSVDEMIRLPNLASQTKRAAVFMHRLTRATIP